MSFSIAPQGRLRRRVRATEVRESVIVGSAVTWVGEFRDLTTNALRDATEVQFLFRLPDGNELAAINGARLSTGTYAATIEPANEVASIGAWVVRLIANGAEVDEETFDVLPSALDAEIEDAVVLVEDDGTFLLLDDGAVMEG